MIKPEYKEENIILTCDEKNFGGYPKMGDLIAVLNIFQHIRNINNNQTIKFYLPDDVLFGHDYVKKFKTILENKTDYFSTVSGNIKLEGSYELWSFREHHGEHIKISNNAPLMKKICIFPLLDANYDNQRNWPQSIFQQIIDEYADSRYDGYERLICCKHIPDNIDIKNFTFSTNFDDNINHILTCEYYIGGATGLSLFNSVLENSFKKSIYYYHHGMHGGWESVFSSPFYIKNKGKLNFYTLDGKIIKILDGYLKNKDDLIYQINYSKINYDKQYVQERYDTYGILNDYMSHLRLGYVVGSIGNIPNSILDVGYGNGAFLKTCKKIIHNCYGFDVTGYELPENINFVEDWVNKEVDVLTMFDVLEHLDNPYILRSIKAKYVIVSVPWCHNHSEEWFLNWKHRRPNEHLWFFNEYSIYKFANRIGFRILNYTNIEDTIRNNKEEKNILTFTMTRI